MTELLTPTQNGPRSTATSSTSRRRVLVVVDSPCTSPELCASVRTATHGDPIEALVIAPAHGSAETQWYVDEDAARADAMHRLRACLACLDSDGIRASGRLGDPDPVNAIGDALHDFAADEILLITAPQRPSTWLRTSAIDRVRRSFHQPIEHIIVSPATPTERKP